MTGKFCTQSVHDKHWADFDQRLAELDEDKPNITTAAMDVSKVKLPEWDPEDPSFWFTVADRKFKVCSPKPSEDLMAALVAEKIPLTILKAHKKAWEDADTPYTKLKLAITGAKRKTGIALFNDLMAAKLDPSAESGASDYIRKALTILAEARGADGNPMTTAGQVHGWLVKQLLERQLPPVVASAMAADVVDADKPQDYMDKVDQQLQQHQASAPQRASVSVVETEETVAAVTNAKGKRQTGKKPGGAKEGGKEGKCYYHARFGAKARAFKGDQGEPCSKKGIPLAKKTD